MFNLDFEKAEEQEFKLPTSSGALKSKRAPEKNIYFYFIPKPLTVWVTTNCGNSSRDENIKPPNLPPENSVCRSRRNS